MERQIFNQTIFLHSYSIKVPLEAGNKRIAEKKKTKPKLEFKTITADIPFKNILSSIFSP